MHDHLVDGLQVTLGQRKHLAVDCNSHILTGLLARQRREHVRISASPTRPAAAHFRQQTPTLFVQHQCLEVFFWLSLIDREVVAMSCCSVSM